MIPKFRVWEHDVKFMNDQVRITYNRFGGNKIFVEVTDGFGWKDVDEKYLMQSTGLHDKNGKEIFEGDVLHVWIEDEYIPNRDSGGGIIDYDCEFGFSQIGKVEFEGGSFDYSTVKTLNGRHEEIHLPIDWLSNYEVLGNIHEHPELLIQPNE